MVPQELDLSSPGEIRFLLFFIFFILFFIRASVVTFAVRTFDLILAFADKFFPIKRHEVSKRQIFSFHV